MSKIYVAVVRNLLSIWIGQSIIDTDPSCSQKVDHVIELLDAVEWTSTLRVSTKVEITDKPAID